MACIIKPGFTGWARLESTPDPFYIRFNSCTLNATQEVVAPDMVMGDYTHNAWAHGKIEVGGALSGPITENSMQFLNAIWYDDFTTDFCDYSNDIIVKYYDGYTRLFKGMVANSVTFNVTAGEVVNFTLELMGTGFETLPDTSYMSSAYDLTYTSKLVTWDKSAMYVGNRRTTNTGFTELTTLQSFNITITRNVTRQFKIQASNLFGDLVQGMSAITGTCVAFDMKTGVGFAARDGAGSGVYHWDEYLNDYFWPIKFNIGDYEVGGTVVFHRATSELSATPVLTTMGFTGVGHYSFGDISPA